MHHSSEAMKLAARVVIRAMSSPDHRWLPSTRMSVASATIAAASRSRVSSASPAAVRSASACSRTTWSIRYRVLVGRWLGDHEGPVDQRAHQLHGPEVVVDDGPGDGVHEPEVEDAREHPEPAEDLVLVLVEQLRPTSAMDASMPGGPPERAPPGGRRVSVRWVTSSSSSVGDRVRARAAASSMARGRPSTAWQSSATACTVRSDRSHRASLRVTMSKKRATAGAAAGSGSAGVGSASGSSTTTRSPATPSGWRLVVSTAPASVAPQNRRVRSTAPASTWSQPSSTTRRRSPVEASASASGELIPASPAMAAAPAPGREVVEPHRR